MVPSYELFLHGFNTMPVVPEGAPMPFWMKLAFGSVFGLVATLTVAIG